MLAFLGSGLIWKSSALPLRALRLGGDRIGPKIHRQDAEIAEITPRKSN